MFPATTVSISAENCIFPRLLLYQTLTLQLLGIPQNDYLRIHNVHNNDETQLLIGLQKTLYNIQRYKTFQSPMT